MVSFGSRPHALIRLPNHKIPSLVFYNVLCHLITYLEHSWVFLSQGICLLQWVYSGFFASGNIRLEIMYHFFLQAISNISIYEKENGLLNVINVISHLTQYTQYPLLLISQFVDPSLALQKGKKKYHNPNYQALRKTTCLTTTKIKPKPMHPHSFANFLWPPSWSYNVDLKHTHVHINIPSETHHSLLTCPNRYRKKVTRKWSSWRLTHRKTALTTTPINFCVCALSDSSLAEPQFTPSTESSSCPIKCPLRN